MAYFREGMEVLRERAAQARINLEQYEGIIPGAIVENLGIPIVVACTDCGINMAGPTAYISPDGHTYCGECKAHRTDENPREDQLSPFA